MRRAESSCATHFLPRLVDSRYDVFPHPALFCPSLLRFWGEYGRFTKFDQSWFLPMLFLGFVVVGGEENSAALTLALSRSFCH